MVDVTSFVKQFKNSLYTYRDDHLKSRTTLKISVNGAGTTARGKPITDSNRVDDILRKFKSKYGGDVKKYYPKIDVAVEVPL
jgi:hypothetical protein